MKARRADAASIADIQIYRTPVWTAFSKAMYENLIHAVNHLSLV